MRQGQNRRMRGRNTSNRKGPNPLQRGYESNGPDVKVRGNAQHIAEKYLQLARDAQSSGDRVMAENYLQHAEHYFRLVLAAQEQITQQYGTTFQPQRFGEDAEDGDDDGDEDGQQPYPFGVAQPGQGQFGQNGDQGDNGELQSGFETQPRQDRGGQDRGGQDRGGNDRNGQERGNQRFDRNQNRNRDRQDYGRQDQNRNGQDRNGQDRNGQDRNDRNDRSARFQDRPDRGESQPDDQPRQDRNTAARQQDYRPDTRGQQPRIGEPRSPRFARPERGPREDQPRTDETEMTEALPAFLTNPVRIPVASEPAPPTEPVEAPAVAADEMSGGEAAVDAVAKRPRGRPRRSPREVMDALATEAADPSAE